MAAVALTPQQAASVLLSRRLARRSLVEYAARVPVPGAPVDDASDTARIPLIETAQAAHHKLIMQAMQRCMTTRYGRLMIMAPPGSAKSTYATVVAPAWFLGGSLPIAHFPDRGRKVLLASHGEPLAKRHGRRTRQLLQSPESQAILQCGVGSSSSAADEFSLTNDAEYLAFGILGGTAGNRAHGLVIDDPIKGRADAESETVRERVRDAYQDDLLSRLVPGGWVVVINTRWHEDDLSGRLLPDDWNGESGLIKCRDGMTWEVLCLQAECESPTDPLGRPIGGMLWPEWFDSTHWAQFRLNRRTWSSLFQQKPAPAKGILFRHDDMAVYERLPEGLRIVCASDNAVTPDGGDWTEQGAAGSANDGGLYLLDWWRGQVGPEVWIERQIDMMVRHKPLAWFCESGPIRRATEGRLRARMAERQVNCRLEYLPPLATNGSQSGKTIGAQSIIATAGMGKLWWPRAAWVAEVQRQCLVFPNGAPDDAVDTLGLLGRGADTLGQKRERPKIPLAMPGFKG